MSMDRRKGYVLPVRLILELVIVLILRQVISATDIRIGVLLPLDVQKVEYRKEYLQPTMDIAMQKIKNLTILQPTFLNGFNVTYTIYDSKCNPSSSAGIVSDNHNKMDVFIGPACSEACISSSVLAAYYDKPVVSYSCDSEVLSDKNIYPTFARVRPYARTYYFLSPFMLNRVMIIIQWSRACIISDNGVTWGQLTEDLKNSLGLKVMKIIYYDGNDRKLELRTPVEELKESCRVIYIMDYPLRVARIMAHAYELNMMNGEYAFIALDFEIDRTWTKESWWPASATLDDVFVGMIVLGTKKPHGELYENFKADLNSRLTSESVANATEENYINGAYLHDAIVTYAYALNNTRAAGNTNFGNGTNLMKQVIGKKFEKSITGVISIDDQGNRKPVYIIFNIQWNTTIVFIFSIDVGDGFKTKHYHPKLIYPGGTTVKPLDEPVCGFQGEKCVEDEPEKNNILPLVLAIVIPSVVFISFGIVFFLYKKKQYEKDLLNKSFFLKYDDIVPVSSNDRVASRVFSRSNVGKSSSEISHRDAQEQVYATLGKYKGEYVAVKKLHKAAVSLTRDVLVELKKVREVRHSNLNPYVGVVVESPNISVVTIYCNRGSLEDVLANDDIKLDWLFRTSFALDIVMGLSFLHQSQVGVHGTLKSSNCLIDSRWVCKVCDFGLDKFKENQVSEADVSESAKYRRLLWKAPEHLDEYNQSKSQPGDVFSYGIILFEIATREEPYNTNVDSYSTREVVNLVSKRIIPPYRPLIPHGTCETKFKELMIKCWDDEPSKRPTANEVKNLLMKMNKGRKTNIVDNMLNMMEKYANHLEDIVEERTKQLAAEKAKTDELLFKMLPKVVAEQLKQGLPVTAESFDCVTIFFSDIVGFTGMAAQSTPLQVVAFLNALYTCFDNVVDNYDVYKVETIGDAYMVVSGLPIRNGDKHAGEIATMALDLLSSVKSFSIPHMPQKRVQLRIGIHSGSCVTGVVGLKMPRYCLFGDTVNYASRMESSGLALRIHVSPECKSVLDKLGGYYLHDRGEVSMKGKGTIRTYFLVGKDGFTKPLPDLSEAASLAEHDFK